MACSAREPPCRPAGVGPSCWVQVKVRKNDNKLRGGFGFSGGLSDEVEDPTAVNGEAITTLPENIEATLADPCCEDCDVVGDSGDGGAFDGTDTEVDPTTNDPDLPGGFASGAGEITGFTVDDEELNKNRGATDKKDCIKEKEEELAEDMQACLCDCFDDAGRNPGKDDPRRDQGMAPYCWGECMGKMEVNFLECFCTDVVCGGAGTDDKDLGTQNDDESTESRRDTFSATPPDPRYEEAFLGPTIDVLQFSDSTYERVVPTVYSRGVVQGNIISTGDVRTLKKCVGAVETDETTGQIVVTTTRIEQTFFDFALAVAEGPVAGIARIWIDGTLVYNNTIEVDGTGTVTDADALTTVENIGIFNRRVDEIDKFDQTLMTITPYLGTEDQPIDPTMNDGIAYRGLAYIVFRNFELTSFNGTVPDIRVEVIKTDSDVEPRQLSILTDSDLRGVKPELLWVDDIDGRIYVGGESNVGGIGEGIRSIRYDDLTEVDQLASGLTDNATEDFDHTTFSLSNGGTIAIQTGAITGTRPVDFITADLNYRRSTYGAHTAGPSHTSTDIGNGALATGHASDFFVLREADGGYATYFVAVSSNDLAFLRVDTITGAISREFVGDLQDIAPSTIRRLVPLVRDTSVPTESSFEVVRSNDIYAVALADASATQLNLYRFIAYATDTNQTFDSTAAPTLLTIPSSVWGGTVTSLTVKQVDTDQRYQSLFIWLEFVDGTGVCIRWSAQSEEVVWAAPIPSMMPFGSSGFRVSNESNKLYYWIGADNEVYCLNKRTGVVTTLGKTPSDYGLPNIGGAQYYDTAASSLTYVTNTNQVGRIFLERVLSGDTPLSEIFTDLFRRAGLEEHEYDVSDIDDVFITGYQVNTNSTLRSVMEQLSVIYNVVARVRQNKIVVTKNDAIATQILDLDNTAANADGIAFDPTQRVDPNSFLQARIEYFDTDSALAKNIQTVATGTRPPRGQADTGAMNLNFPFAGTAAFASALAERVLYDAVYRDTEFTCLAGQATLDVEPGDRVLVNIPDLGIFTYFVRETSIGADKSVQYTLKLDDNEAASFSAGVVPADPIIDNATEGVITDLEVLSGVRPLPLVTNAVIPEDVRRGFTSQTALYAGVCSTEDTFSETPVYLRSASGVTINVGSVTEPLTWGISLSAPDDVISCYSTDRTSELVVRFSRSGADANMVTEDHDTFFNAFGKNLLLVNQELIQFRTFSVDPDGVTYRFRDLLRGRHGTEQYIGAHTAGEFVALYTPESWVRADTNVQQALGDSVFLSISIGVTSAAGFAEEPVFVDHDFLKFYGVVNLRRTFSAGGNMLFAFAARPRIELSDDGLGDTSPDLPDINFEAYILSSEYVEQSFVDALAGDNPGYIIRTKDNLESASFTYSTAEQVADGFDYLTDTLYVAVFATPDDLDTIYPIPRGHPNHRAIGPTFKW